MKATFFSLRIIIPVVSLLLILHACTGGAKRIEGKIKRESISIVSKVPGRIMKMLVNEGDRVQKGDTLAFLSVPEVEAKIEQARGAVRSANAQYQMALKGATANQLKMIQAKYDGVKEQYQFVKKTYDRISLMYEDTLVSPQQHDEVFAKYQTAKAQYDAVSAEYDEVKRGVRDENILMALGQKERADGALEETLVAYDERIIRAPADMTVETSALHEGELALPGYPIFAGYIETSTYFRFTLPESSIGMFHVGDAVVVTVPYKNNEQFQAKIIAVKQLSRYADITTAYPDYELSEAVYELKAEATEKSLANSLYANATVIISSIK